METQEYKVDLSRHASGLITTASVRTFHLDMGAKSGDPSNGFNPVETLLAAAGACITSSLGLVAGNSHVQINRLDVTVIGTRQDSPPRLISIHYRLTIDSPDSDERIRRVIQIAERNSTVLSTLKESVVVRGEWHRALEQT